MSKILAKAKMTGFPAARTRKGVRPLHLSGGIEFSVVTVPALVAALVALAPTPTHAQTPYDARRKQLEVQQQQLEYRRQLNQAEFDRQKMIRELERMDSEKRNDGLRQQQQLRQEMLDRSMKNFDQSLRQLLTPRRNNNDDD